jgi:hypothetical protein
MNSRNAPCALNLISMLLLLWRSYTSPGKCVAMYMCAMGIDLFLFVRQNWYMCVPVPNQDVNFQHHMSLFSRIFKFSKQKWKVIVRLVDIGKMSIIKCKIKLSLTIGRTNIKVKWYWKCIVNEHHNVSTFTLVIRGMENTIKLTQMYVDGTVILKSYHNSLIPVEHWEENFTSFYVHLSNHQQWFLQIPRNSYNEYFRDVNPIVHVKYSWSDILQQTSLH